MHFIHFLIVPGLADQNFYISEGYRQAALLIDIYGVGPDAVLVCRPYQLHGQIQSELVFGQDRGPGVGVCQHYAVNDGRFFNAASRNGLDDSFL